MNVSNLLVATALGVYVALVFLATVFVLNHLFPDYKVGKVTSTITPSPIPFTVYTSAGEVKPPDADGWHTVTPGDTVEVGPFDMAIQFDPPIIIPSTEKE